MASTFRHYKPMVRKNCPVTPVIGGRTAVRFSRCEPGLKAQSFLIPKAITQAKRNISSSCVYRAEF